MEDLRRKILTASLRLMEEGGLAALSMREVARRAGVSHQAPYHYFEDREAILAEIVREGFEQLHDRMVAAQAGLDDPDARYAAVGAAYVGFALDRPAHFRIMFRSEHVDLSRHEAAKVCADRAFSVLTSVIGGRSPAGAPVDMAEVIASWSLAHGLATLFLEGKLDRFFGIERDARAEATRAVLDVFQPRRRG
jgi:AcrR family transcriptional regulator